MQAACVVGENSEWFTASANKFAHTTASQSRLPILNLRLFGDGLPAPVIDAWRFYDGGLRLLLLESAQATGKVLNLHKGKNSETANFQTRPG